MLSVDGNVEGLAVNPEEDKLYISVYYDAKIYVTSLDGTGKRTFINCNGSPKGLAVDLNRRYYFHAMRHICCNKYVCSVYLFRLATIYSFII